MKSVAALKRAKTLFGYLAAQTWITAKALVLSSLKFDTGLGKLPTERNKKFGCDTTPLLHIIVS